MSKCTGSKCPMQVGYKVDECNHTDCPYRTEPITNGDRIRAMTDEELAKWFGHFTICGQIQTNEYEWCETNGTCTNCVLRWLKQPAKENKT